MSESLRLHGLHSQWNSPGQNTGMGSLSLLQRIFPTQVSSKDLLHYRQILYQLSYRGSPWIQKQIGSWIFLICESVSALLYTLTFIIFFSSVQFSSVAQSCPTLCDPMNHSTPGLPVHHHLPEFTQTHVHRVHDAIQPSHPRSSPSPPAPNSSQHQSLFQ